MEPFECRFCNNSFEFEYDVQDVYHEDCDEWSYNSYVDLYCPHCQKYISVSV